MSVLAQGISMSGTFTVRSIQRARLAASLALLGLVSACGGGGSGTPVTPPAPVTYTVGGTVSGVSGTGLVLQNNAGNDLAVAANGSFTFSTALASGAAYAVTVKTQPSTPTQNCVVTSGSGTLGSANVTSVAVTCTTATFTVGGTVSGLTGLGLVLQNNAANDLPVSANGSFTFSSAVASGGAYAVTIKTQPSSPSQTCSLSAATGTVTSSNVTSVVVTCVPVSTGSGKFGYVTNEGSNNISAYSINATTGAMTAIAGSPFAAGAGPSAVAISPSGRFLAVGNLNSNNVSVYTIDSSTGVLTPIAGSPFATGLTPTSLSFSTNGSFLYVVNIQSETISAFTVNATSGVLTAVAGSPFAAGPLSGTLPNTIVVEPSGKFALVANQAGNSVSVFNINATTGALSHAAGSPFVLASGSSPTSLALGAGGKFVYTSGGTTTNRKINALSLNATSGALTALAGSPLAITSDHDIGSDLAGSFLYSTVGSTLGAYAIDQSSGALTAVAGSPFAAGTATQSMATDRANKFVFVANRGAGTVSVYALNATTGALTQVPGSPYAAGTSPDYIAVL